MFYPLLSLHAPDQLAQTRASCTHIYIPTAHMLGAWKSERFLTLLTPPGNGNTSHPGNVETADVPSPAWHRACGAMSVTGCDGNGHLAPLAEAGLCS